MNVMWVPVIIICLTTTPRSECNEENPDVTVLRAEPQTTPMACLTAAMTRYADYANSPRLGQPLEPRFICREKHSS